MIQVLSNRLAAVLTCILVSACASPTPAPAPSSPPSAKTTACGTQPGCPTCPACPVCPSCPTTSTPSETSVPAVLIQADWSALPGWTNDDQASAWPAFLASCKAIGRQRQWADVCSAASLLGARPSTPQVRSFFEQHLVPWQSFGPDRTATGLVTGYYEPLIKGSRTRSAQHPWPVHAPPEDMLTIDLSSVYPDLKNLRLRGRLEGNRVVPYWSRAELAQRQDKLPLPVLFWASDSIDLFFLQVQGSGRIELPDGSQARIGYADQNGHPYQSIGRWLISQGQLSADKASMEGIKQWARDNPSRLAEMLNSNPSYVFFRELPASNSGPIGALGVPVSEGRSIAIDPAHVPLGAPVFLATSWPLSERPLNRLVMAQDTGGAIKGPVRVDFFWGFGAKAGAEAGRMRQQGQVWVLLPRGSTPSEMLKKP